MPTLEENLQSARTSMTEVQQLKPEAHEIEAIKAFCHAEIAKRAATEEISGTLKGLRQEVKSIRDSLVAVLKDTEHQTLMLSKADAKRLEDSAAAAGLPSMPPYVRLIVNSKDSSVTPEVIQEALEAITQEDLQEAAGAVGPDAGPHAALKHVVLANIRRLVRNFTEQVRLNHGLPRGLGHYDVAEAASSVADSMYRLWTLENQIKSALEAKRAQASETRSTDELKRRIETFFVRTGLTAQRIVVEGRTYRLVRRVSVRRPKVGLSKLEDFLNAVLAEPGFQGARVRTAELIRGLHIQLASVPPETKTSVSLCAVRQPVEE